MTRTISETSDEIIEELDLRGASPPVIKQNILAKIASKVINTSRTVNSESSIGKTLAFLSREPQLYIYEGVSVRWLVGRLVDPLRFCRRAETRRREAIVVYTNLF